MKVSQEAINTVIKAFEDIYEDEDIVDADPEALLEWIENQENSEELANAFAYIVIPSGRGSKGMSGKSLYS